VVRTAADALLRLPRFVEGAWRIHRATARVDVVVNFLDLVGGISRCVFRTETPAVAIAHNYVFLHRQLANAPGSPLARRAVLTYAKATAGRAATKVALSYAPLPRDDGQGLVVTPPLLRPELADLSVRDDGHLLAYALNAGYGDLLADWHRRQEHVTVHCYLDGGRGALRSTPAEGFHAHALSDDGFLRHLAACRAYVGSAGFESVCEAFYLGKPALIVPTDGQLEQTLNAWDAQRVGAAVAGTYADLDSFWKSPPIPSDVAIREFRSWVRTAPEALVAAVERAARTGRGAA
jgi:uncharacterized protein (TIGR00661 family)